MKTPTLRGSALLCLLAAGLTAQDQTTHGNHTVTGNLTVAGDIGAVGAVISTDDTFTFGTQGAGFGARWLYADAATDTLTNTLNRATASWLWQHLAAPSGYLPAMRLTSAHQLLLYKADGTTAGVRLKPETTQLLLGAAQLTADGTTLGTNGHFSVGGDFTVNNGGAFRSGTNQPLNLGPGSANQPINFSTTGTGDIVFNTGGAERARIKSNGYVGIGTANPASMLDVAGTATVNYLQVDAWDGSADEGGEILLQGAGSYGPIVFDNFQGNARILGLSGGKRFEVLGGSVFVDGGGNNFFGGPVGIGTPTPGYKLQVMGGIASSHHFVNTSADPYVRTDADNKYLVLSGGSGWSSTASTMVLRGASAAANPHGLELYAGGAERFRIEGNGNIAMGGGLPTPALASIWNPYNTGTDSLRFNYNDGNAYWMGIQPYVVGGANVGYKFRTNNLTATVDALAIAGDGRIGIGTTTPSHSLTIQGTPSYPYLLNVGGTSNGRMMVRHIDGKEPGGAVVDNLYLQFAVNKHTILNAESTGFVGIGTMSPTHRLTVNGTIRAKEVIVDTGWADYVFEADYRLAPLSEVEAHIRAKKHLPGIPSAAEVEAHGVSLGEMQSRLLAKVEELTLHLIAQGKALQAQNAEISRLHRQLQELQPASR